MRNPFALLEAVGLFADGSNPPFPGAVLMNKDKDEFFSVRRANPEFEDLDFRKEYDLIREKKSRFSANKRALILLAVERADAVIATQQTLDSLA